MAEAGSVGSKHYPKVKLFNKIHFIFGPVDEYGQRSSKGEGKASDGQYRTEESLTEDPSLAATTEAPVVAAAAEEGPEMEMTANPDSGGDVTMEGKRLLLEEGDQPQGMSPNCSFSQ